MIGEVSVRMNATQSGTTVAAIAYTAIAIRAATVPGTASRMVAGRQVIELHIARMERANGRTPAAYTPPTSCRRVSVCSKADPMSN